MAHEHNHTHQANKKILTISFIIIFSYMVVEAVGGYVTNSLALLSDAGHMLSDAVSLAIALLAFLIAEKAITLEKTFGYKRVEILAACLNGITLIVIALFIFIEAIHRFMNPPQVATIGMLIISSIGLIVNVAVAWIMFKGSDTEENLNMRGAFLHVISDMLGSIGAIIAALLMMAFNWGWADPLASVIVAILVLRSGTVITKNAVHILMEGTPKAINTELIIKTIQKRPEVKGVHDVHFWAITSGFHAMSCHIVVDELLTIKESSQLLQKLEHELLHQNIQHATFQLETEAQTHGDSLICKVKPNVASHHHH